MIREVKMAYYHYLKVKLPGHKYSLQVVGWYLFMNPERYMRDKRIKTESDKVNYELHRAAGIRFTGPKEWWEFWR